jgi:hypothetical protein
MPRVDHDQRFKALIREFLREFIRLFFPEWYERFDFDNIEWLDKEIFLDPPLGETRDLDLVAKVRLRQAVASQRHGEPDGWIILIHIEVEADDRLTRLRPRMHDYYKGLRDRHHLPVWSMALYLHVGLEGVGWDVYEEYLWERRVLHFEYPYVGLPGLDAEQYRDGENILGVALAALMRVPDARRAELRAHALRRIGASEENDYRKYLLAECVEQYLGLDEGQQREFERLLASEPYREARTVAMTSFDKGEAVGMEKGQRRFLLRLLEKQFGPLPQQVRQRVESFGTERLEQIGEAILENKSLKELGLED